MKEQDMLVKMSKEVLALEKENKRKTVIPEDRIKFEMDLSALAALARLALKPAKGGA